VGVPANLSIKVLSMDGIRLVLNWAVQTVGLVVGVAVLSAVDTHGAITSDVVAHSGSVGAVDWDLIIVSTKSVSVGVGVIQKSSLEHSVIAGLNSRDQVGGCEGGLLCLSVIVGGVAVEHNLSDWDQWVVTVGPHFCDIKNIESIFFSIFLRHNLNKPGPRGEVALFDVVVEVVCSELRVLDSHGGGLCSGEVLNALVGLIVVLHIMNVSLCVNPFESVAAVAVYVTVTLGGATVAHKNSDLVESFGRVRPEVPGHIGVLRVISGVSLLGVDKVRELDGIFNEKHGGIISDHVVVTFFSVMLKSPTTGIAIAVIGTSLSSNSREAEEDWCFLSDLVHKLGFAKTKK